jgi:hypothetical protein
LAYDPAIRVCKHYAGVTIDMSAHCPPLASGNELAFEPVECRQRRITTAEHFTTKFGRGKRVSPKRDERLDEVSTCTESIGI